MSMCRVPAGKGGPLLARPPLWSLSAIGAVLSSDDWLPAPPGKPTF